MTKCNLFLECKDGMANNFDHINRMKEKTDMITSFDKEKNM